MACLRTLRSKLIMYAQLAISVSESRSICSNTVGNKSFNHLGRSEWQARNQPESDFKILKYKIYNMRKIWNKYLYIIFQVCHSTRDKYIYLQMKRMMHKYYGQLGISKNSIKFETKKMIVLYIKSNLTQYCSKRPVQILV